MTDLAAALSRLAWLEGRQGQVRQSRAHATEAIELAHELGLRLCEIWATAALGDLELGAGPFVRSADLVQAAGIGCPRMRHRRRGPLTRARARRALPRLGQPGPARQSGNSVRGASHVKKGSRGRSPERPDAAVFWLTTSKWTESSPGRWSSTRRRPTCSRRPGRVWLTALGYAATGRGPAPGTSYVPPSRSSITSAPDRGRKWPGPSWPQRGQPFVSATHRPATSSLRRSSRSPCCLAVGRTTPASGGFAVP